MHKVLVEFYGEKLKVLVKKKNITLKFANNHKTIYHNFYCKKHMVSKELIWDYSELTPVYHELTVDFDAVGLIDLEFYERWLNG